MIGSRTITALFGLLVGLLLSVVAWIYFDTPALFLILPFVPFLFWRPGEGADPEPVRTCPVCEFRTRTPSFEYCPHDGHRLESDAAEERR